MRTTDQPTTNHLAFLPRSLFSDTGGHLKKQKIRFLDRNVLISSLSCSDFAISDYAALATRTQCQELAGILPYFVSSSTQFPNPILKLFIWIFKVHNIKILVPV